MLLIPSQAWLIPFYTFLFFYTLLTPFNMLFISSYTYLTPFYCSYTLVTPFSMFSLPTLQWCFLHLIFLFLYFSDPSYVLFLSSCTLLTLFTCYFSCWWGASGEFSVPVNFVCWLLFSVCSIPMLPQWHVKDPGHSAKSAGDRLHLNSHTPLAQRSQSRLTMLLSGHSMGT